MAYSMHLTLESWGHHLHAVDVGQGSSHQVLIMERLGIWTPVLDVLVRDEPKSILRVSWRSFLSNAVTAIRNLSLMRDDWPWP